MKSTNYVYITMIALLTFVMSCYVQASGNQCVDLFKQHRDAGMQVVSKKTDGSDLTAREVEDRLKDLVKKYFINFQKIAKARRENKEIKELNTYQEELSRQIDEIMRAEYSIPGFNEILKKLFIEELERIRKEYDAQSNKRATADQREKDRKSRKERERQERERIAIEEARDPIHQAEVKKIIFHEIQPGEFMMGEIDKQVTLTQPFAMMQTLFTQMMYSRLMIAFGEKDPELINPSYFKTGNDSLEVEYNGITYLMKPDHPVESVSWVDLRGNKTLPHEPPSPESFLGKLNKLSNSDNLNDQALLEKLIPGHQKGDIYDLPTEDQTEFVNRNRGKANEVFFDRKTSDEMDQYAWYKKNSKTKEYPNGTTHAVNTLKPRMIDQGDGTSVPFYHLKGNVWKWTKDGVNPLSMFKDDYVRGGGFSNYASDLYREYIYRGSGQSNVGFRLVRTRL